MLLPNDPESYYRQRDLVPVADMPRLGQAKILIANVHAFQLRETVALPRTTRQVVAPDDPGRFTESPDQMVRRVCRELGTKRNVIVLNDEAHHIRGHWSSGSSRNAGWGAAANVEHVTYCTAKIVGERSAQARQAAYLRALELSGTVDRIEYGLFKERYREFPQATRDAKGRPVLPGNRVALVGVSVREEKGSDVNLASHLLMDALRGEMDAAVVVSSDSDLELPVREVRKLMPVGTISPQGEVHGSLRPEVRPGSGHWYHQVDLADLLASQLPDPCRGIACPREWK